MMRRALFASLALLLFLASSVFAQNTRPYESGTSGLTNGNLVKSGATAGQLQDAGVNLGTLTNTDLCTYTSSGTVINCNTAPITHTATVGWIAGVNPNNAAILIFSANSTLMSIVGNVEIAAGAAATVSVNVAASGTACSAGTTVHSGSFNANGTAATNQTLTLTTTAMTSGSRLCLQTTGTWTAAVGVLTATYTTP